MEHLIEFKDVYRIYQMGEESVHALDGVSLTVDKGEFVAIVGSSGSGKSTAANMVLQLLKPTKGKVYFDGEDTSQMSEAQLFRLRRS